MKKMDKLLLTVLAALLLLGTTGCVVYDPYLYPDYGYAYPAYSPPAVGVAPFFGLYAPWGISGYYYAPYGYYGGHGYYRGPYGYYGGHGYYRGPYGGNGHGGNGHGGGNNQGGGGQGSYH